MDLLKAIRDNYLLISAILFVLLLIAYALFYKRNSKKEVKEVKEVKEDKEAKKNRNLFIQYTFYLIFGTLAIYALYLIYIQYFKHSSGRVMTGGGGTHYQFTSNDIKISGEDVDIGFMD